MLNFFLSDFFLNNSSNMHLSTTHQVKPMLDLLVDKGTKDGTHILINT